MQNREAIDRPEDVRKERNIYLDFFRGIALLIIFISHVPGNWWYNWLPGRFGFSDAPDLFVFCSGAACALAFAPVFQKRGYFLGICKIVNRVYQIYISHIMIFIFVVAILTAADFAFHPSSSFGNFVHLQDFNFHTQQGILGLASLTYTPYFFDILPLYIVLLLCLPLFITLASLNRWLALLCVLGVWLLAQLNVLNLPAEPWSDRTWFFNPFGWQLIFFVGFAFSLGWLQKPKVTPIRLMAAAAFLICCATLSFSKLVNSSHTLAELNGQIPEWLYDKTHFGLLRLVHFLVASYVALGLIERLKDRFGGPFVILCCRLGSHSLSVFLAGLALSEIAGVALEVVGHSHAKVAIVNLLGLSCLIAISDLLTWFKTAPWKQASSPWPFSFVQPFLRDFVYRSYRQIS